MNEQDALETAGEVARWKMTGDQGNVSKLWLANCYFASLSRRKMPSGPKGNNYIHPLLQLNCRNPPLPFRCVITTTVAMSKHFQIRVSRKRLDGN